MNWEDRTADYYIQKMFRQWNLADFASELQVENTYKRLAGDLIVRLTESIRYKKGVLRLRFMSAALRQEMTWRRDSLQQKMNEELGGDVIKKIIIN